MQPRGRRIDRTGGEEYGRAEHLVKMTADLARRVGRCWFGRRSATADVQQYGLDLEPQEAATAWHECKSRQQAKVDQTLAELDNLRASIFRILEKQVRARARNGLIAGKMQIAEALASAGEVRSMQVDIQKSTIALVKAIGDSSRQEHQAVKRVLNQLAFGEMIAAVSECDKLVQAKTIEELPATVGTRGRRARSSGSGRCSTLFAARSGRACGRKTWSATCRPKREKLEAQRSTEKALEQQNRSSGAENLAKAPVEDFAEARDQLIKALEAAEDDWSRFMTELNAFISCPSRTSPTRRA